MEKIETVLEVKAGPSIFHQFTKMTLGNVAGFIMQKLVENAYDQFIISRQNKVTKSD
jgi:hypothetical protein